MPLDYSNLDSLLQQINLAEGMDEQELAEIGSQVVKDFEQDLESRHTWEEQHEKWMKLAIQVIEEKTWPWRNASNVKYPLLATSAMQFQARAYPTLVTVPNVVKARVIGEDPTGEKAKRAERIGKHMSYQVLEEMENWDEDMDRACFILPIVGCIFKKIYYHQEKGYNCSDLVLPKDLVINYWAKDLKSATTKTHVLYMTKNTVREKQLSGDYLDYKLDQSSPKELNFEMKAREKEGMVPPGDTSGAPLIILEQHCWFDLDKDDYKEPYIVTVDYSQQKVVRISPRFEKDGVTVKDGKITKIEPEEYFIKFSFIPNPDGGFYDLGFGALLGPLNETVNTLINQLIDSGTINNLQGGFIAKGIRLKAGDTSFTPGEWKFVQTSGDDLRKGIFPLVTKEPSGTLFQLLGTIVESGQKLASVAEIFVGKMPGQNTPATTTMATIEQGMKVFTAIYKRIYRSLTKEFKRLYRLNKIYLSPEAEFNVVDSADLMRIGQSDYQQDDTDVRPAADPTSVSEMLRLTKAQAILELIPLGTVNPQEATKRILEAQDQPEIEKLMAVGPPPPDPKMLELQAKMEMDKEKSAMKQKEMGLKMMIDQNTAKMDAAMKQMDMQLEAARAHMELSQAEKKHMLEIAQAHDALITDRVKAIEAIQSQQSKHAQEIRHMEEKGKAEVSNIKAKEQAKPKKRKVKQVSDTEYEVEES